MSSRLPPKLMGCYIFITLSICISLALSASGISNWVAWSKKGYREVVGIVVESKTCEDACVHQGSRWDGAELTVTYEIDREVFTFESDYCICTKERKKRSGEQMKLYYPSSDLSDATYKTWKYGTWFLWAFSVIDALAGFCALLCVFFYHCQHYLSQKALPPVGLLCMTSFFSAVFVFLIILAIMMFPF